uniref:IBB domain-containing protein n=1 Tax=Ditylenchus dipsaci TaxID=166011 RepID=A0A915EC40_9BILA
MQRQYKNAGKDAETLRKNRVDQVVMLRKEKRDDVMAKKRNIMLDEDLLQESHVVGENNSPSDLVLRAQSSDPEVQFKAVVDVRKLLSSGRSPPMDGLIAAGMLPILVRCLESSDPKLHWKLLGLSPSLFFSLIGSHSVNVFSMASGTSEQTLAVVGAGAVPLFIELLKSPSHEVSEQAVWALGNIIGMVLTFRDYCLNLGVLPSLLITSLLQLQWNFLRNVLGASQYLPQQKPFDF